MLTRIRVRSRLAQHAAREFERVTHQRPPVPLPQGRENAAGNRPEVELHQGSVPPSPAQHQRIPTPPPRHHHAPPRHHASRTMESPAGRGQGGHTPEQGALRLHLLTQPIRGVGIPPRGIVHESVAVGHLPVDPPQPPIAEVGAWRDDDTAALVMIGREPVAQQPRVRKEGGAEDEDRVVTRELRRRGRAGATVGFVAGVEGVDGGESTRAGQPVAHVRELARRRLALDEGRIYRAEDEDPVADGRGAGRAVLRFRHGRRRGGQEQEEGHLCVIVFACVCVRL
jgi:hypothetical protein